jgi:hypothetical protein
LGIADGNGLACVQCLDAQERTGGGTVTSGEVLSIGV